MLGGKTTELYILISKSLKHFENATQSGIKEFWFCQHVIENEYT